MMPIQIREGVVEVGIEKQKFLPLNQLEENSTIKDKGRIYKYFLA